MKRRSALKSMGLALGGLVSLPAWATNWTPESIGRTTTLSENQELLLSEIVEAIIPETTTAGKVSPGAKSLKVHQFAARMISDCYPASAQEILQKGLANIDAAANKTYSKSFTALTPKERVSVLTAMSTASDATEKQFVNMIKNLTIQGYTNSEYYMNNVLKYNMAPGFYHGCVPVAS
ncbi:gluconate 2-dehydrogenase subunit 3 family protein [Telluribacter humicola]|uniref:gluconate 2-dehydrogenase subunit 3 family protein n=1 Tax=Telluribacter humicola TaxID=1720261 RepID=UPI001A96FBD2|nr:gluconate 2-dehydrogenase subunit 3 family protein [Telluribacter humicola]